MTSYAPLSFRLASPDYGMEVFKLVQILHVNLMCLPCIESAVSHGNFKFDCLKFDLKSDPNLLKVGQLRWLKPQSVKKGSSFF